MENCGKLTNRLSESISFSSSGVSKSSDKDLLRTNSWTECKSVIPIWLWISDLSMRQCLAVIRDQSDPRITFVVRRVCDLFPTVSPLLPIVPIVRFWSDSSPERVSSHNRWSRIPTASTRSTPPRLSRSNQWSAIVHRKTRHQQILCYVLYEQWLVRSDFLNLFNGEI